MVFSPRLISIRELFAVQASMPASAGFVRAEACRAVRERESETAQAAPIMAMSMALPAQ